jgi:hypothetical protein
LRQDCVYHRRHRVPYRLSRVHWQTNHAPGSKGISDEARQSNSAGPRRWCRQGPKLGVVDPNCQVWGTDGLYVVDASVFPSASGVNPINHAPGSKGTSDEARQSNSAGPRRWCRQGPRGPKRMSKSPKLGVVDPNCQVWGTDGLYVVDASVFPSASDFRRSSSIQFCRAASLVPSGASGSEVSGRMNGGRWTRIVKSGVLTVCMLWMRRCSLALAV